MRALIAHRRLITDGNGHQVYHLAIGIRNFACFNGFNVTGAFSKMMDTDLNLVTGLQGQFTGQQGGYLRNSAEVSSFTSGKTAGPWECVAIGWMHSQVLPSSSGPVRSRDRTTGQWDQKIGNALRREGHQARYYDAYNGVYLNSLRALTPNEQYLSNVFNVFEMEGRTPVPNDVMNLSSFATAMNFNYAMCGCLYQFVGSERPAGQAVAFLQTFRNISEVQHTGWTGANQVKGNIIRMAYDKLDPVGQPQRPTAPRALSIIPLMDHLVNYGTDNAITCYAGNGVMLQGMRAGFWSLKEWFRDPRSMLEEGRYNKGSQSSTLMANYNRANNSMASGVMARASVLFDGLRTSSINTPPNVAAMVSFERIQQAASAGVIDDLIRRVTENIRFIANSDLSSRVNELMEMAAVYVDLRTPEVPVEPPVPAPPPAPRPQQGAAESATPRNTTVGAAVGFVQWISTSVH